MSAEINEEKYFKMLRESAVQRYGEERTKIIEPSIRDLARSLAVISEYPLAMEEEPDFYG